MTLLTRQIGRFILLALVALASLAAAPAAPAARAQGAPATGTSVYLPLVANGAPAPDLRLRSRPAK